jgi:hypothetical protein
MKKWIIFFLVLFLFSFVSAGNYGTGNFGGGSYSIVNVTITAPPETAPSSGGGCTYDWNCTNWFPSECPVSEKQERLCVNRGTCSGLEHVPDQIRTCVYEHKEPLFDIFLKILDNNKKICAGKKIEAEVKLQNYGREELLDAFMTYWVIDENNTLISELKDTRNVVNNLDFNIALSIPESVSDGTYRLYAEITYLGNKTAVAGESFEINKNYCALPRNIIFPLIIGLIIIGILFLIIIRLRKHPLTDEKIREQIKKTLEEIKKKREAKKIEKQEEPLSDLYTNQLKAVEEVEKENEEKKSDETSEETNSF